MITDADIKKMKAAFATKDELKKLDAKVESVDKKVDASVVELINFIGETKVEIMSELSSFRNEMTEFRVEMRDVHRSHQSTLNNHEVRIARLEFTHTS